jgi:hypothetical protein
MFMGDKAVRNFGLFSGRPQAWFPWFPALAQPLALIESDEDRSAEHGAAASLVPAWHRQIAFRRRHMRQLYVSRLSSLHSSVARTTDKTRDAMRWSGFGLSRWHAVSNNSQKYALECLRLAAACTRLADNVRNRELETNFLASDVHNRALEIHFLRMAKEWTARAEPGACEFSDQVIH